MAEHQAAYNTLPSADKEALMKGLIARGQTPEQVYIVLGQPNVITASADGTATIWTYSNYLPPLPAGQLYNATKKRKNTPRPVTATDPLLDSMQAWQANVDRRGQVMSDPETVPQAAGQSYADYGRYLQEGNLINERAEAPLTPQITRGLSGNSGSIYTKILDADTAQAYNESNAEFPLRSPLTVKLDVVFVRQTVADAIINESQSAFTSSQP